MLKKINCFRLCALLLAALYITACGSGQDVAAGKTLEDFQGKIVLVNYWAEWCAPCREEIPALNRLQVSHPEVHVVGVNFDGVKGDELSQQVAALGIEFPSLAIDPRPGLGLEPPSGLPETLVIDKAGKLITVMRGPQAEQSLAAQLAALP